MQFLFDIYSKIPLHQHICVSLYSNNVLGMSYCKSNLGHCHSINIALLYTLMIWSLN